MDMSLINQEIANATGRTIGAVQHRRDFLRKPKPECKLRKTGKWSKDEIKLIMNSEMSVGELAEKLDVLSVQFFCFFKTKMLKYE